MIHSFLQDKNILDFRPTLDFNTIKLLSSALSIAFYNSGCTVPAFIQHGNPSQQLFHGVSLVKSSGIFDKYLEQRVQMSSLSNIPLVYGNLSALIDIFKQRFEIVTLDSNGIHFYLLRLIIMFMQGVASLYRGIFASIIARYDTKPKESWSSTNLKSLAKFGLSYGQESDPVALLQLETKYLSSN